ncbi:MAG: energy transducer TonB [Gemmatimonadaceae bacterium]|nr:energy transducer TonB [Gemmatimonadaceae bacterium]
MFTVLLESNAVVKRPLGGSLVSTAGHVAAVAGLVVATMQSTVVSPPEPPQQRHVFVPVTPAVAPPRPPVERVASTSPGTVAALGTIAIAINPDISVGIPPIDLSRSLEGLDNALQVGARGRPDGMAGGSGAEGMSASDVFTDATVEKPVILRSGASPRYPEMLRSAGLSGSVLVEFVVDTLGRVEAGTTTWVSSDHELLSAAVRAVLPSYRFLPAEVQGRKVRQLVRVPFKFDVHD